MKIKKIESKEKFRLTVTGKQLGWIIAALNFVDWDKAGYVGDFFDRVYSAANDLGVKQADLEFEPVE